jgi:transcriptional regulator with PAS, ATPase and Fis domain
LTTEENHEGNVEHSSEKLTYSKEAIAWRRSRIQELDSQGYSHREIVSKLQIAKGTVSSDLAYIRRQAQANLQHHIHETIPMEYQRGMIGLRQNLKHVLEIAETTADPRVKLEARRIASDIYDKIMTLSTNGVIVNDALRFIQSKIEHINHINNHNNVSIHTSDIEPTTTEEGTTNEVF